MGGEKQSEIGHVAYQSNELGLGLESRSRDLDEGLRGMLTEN